MYSYIEEPDNMCILTSVRAHTEIQTVGQTDGQQDK